MLAAQPFFVLGTAYLMEVGGCGQKIIQQPPLVRMRDSGPMGLVHWVCVDNLGDAGNARLEHLDFQHHLIYCQ